MCRFLGNRRLRPLAAGAWRNVRRNRRHPILRQRCPKDQLVGTRTTRVAEIAFASASSRP